MNMAVAISQKKCFLPLFAAFFAAERGLGGVE
jgi:hypothetical protein